MKKNEIIVFINENTFKTYVSEIINQIKY